jgi:ABC-type Na+ transport system ATPase subunit NatA
MWTDAYVVASHHLDDMQRICDRAVVLSAGLVIADANVNKLRRTMGLELPIRAKRGA